MVKPMRVASLLAFVAAATQAQQLPELLARGVISTAAPEFAATMTPDGQELYFNRASSDRSTLTVMVSRRQSSGEWSAARVAPFSGIHRDVDPFVTTDGKRLYFSSDRPRRPGGPRVFATWFVERMASGWTDPRDPGAPLNSEADDVFFTMARDGMAVFTSSRGNDGPRAYTSRESAGQWTTPTLLTFGSVGDLGNPAIAPSSRFVVGVRVAAGGSADLFLSCRTPGGWAEPRALTAVNSEYADFAPSIDAGETSLIFTSERPGVVGRQAAGVRPPGDLYRVSLEAAGISCP